MSNKKQNNQQVMETAKTSKKMNKFATLLSTNDKSLLENRARILSTSVESAMKSQKLKLEEDINDIDMKLAKHEDLGIETTDSMRMPDIDAKIWVRELNELSIEKYRLEEVYEIVKNNYDKYFGE